MKDHSRIFGLFGMIEGGQPVARNWGAQTLNAAAFLIDHDGRIISNSIAQIMAKRANLIHTVHISRK